MKKSFINNIEEINKNIKEAESLLRESMSFYEDENEEFDSETFDTEEEVVDNVDEIEPEANLTNANGNIESYVDHIRKYSLNGLSALCDNPESEEYQMLKKIFQMCDKKPEKREGITESHRLFGISKENKEVLFETIVETTKDFNKLKN